MRPTNYDFIFLGTGCASLSIVMRMIKSGKFHHKKMLLIDKAPKTINDRTWCFWEKTPGFFEEIVYHKWNELFFKNEEESISLNLGNYQYKMVRGIDFYEKCFSIITLQDNIDIMYGEISFEESAGEFQTIKIDGKKLATDENTVIFNSISRPSKKQKGKYYLLQHFKGWIIETKENFFNPSQATLMDFSVSQTHGTTFVYVLPISEKKALIEYTLFSEQLLPQKDYDDHLKKYLANISGLKEYKIIEEEFGIIPMTNENLPAFKNGMYFIGTSGGATKPSTGYTFRFIQKQADQIVKELLTNGLPSKKRKIQKRFSFYDSTLLQILAEKKLAGKTIFSILFKKNPAFNIFKFLDNESSLKEELLILNSLPKKIFSKAGFIEFLKIKQGG